jgi:hypothetical protein
MSWRARETAAACTALLALGFAACGGTGSDPVAAPEPPATATGVGSSNSSDITPVTDAAGTATPAEPVVEPGGATEEASPEPSVTPSAPTPSAEPATTIAPAEQREPAWPDDGCSPDNSPTVAGAADGPAPVVAVRSGSAGSPLPDLAVRRINCKGGWENLRNELPADRPLLVWFWAPH